MGPTDGHRPRSTARTSMSTGYRPNHNLRFDRPCGLPLRDPPGPAPVRNFGAASLSLQPRFGVGGGPLALSAAARPHPTLIIFCFLSSGILFGIAGVILAVPVALTTKITLAILYDETSKR